MGCLAPEPNRFRFGGGRTVLFVPDHVAGDFRSRIAPTLHRSARVDTADVVRTGTDLVEGIGGSCAKLVYPNSPTLCVSVRAKSTCVAFGQTDPTERARWGGILLQQDGTPACRGTVIPQCARHDATACDLSECTGRSRVNHRLIVPPTAHVPTGVKCTSERATSTYLFVLATRHYEHIGVVLVAVAPAHQATISRRNATKEPTTVREPVQRRRRKLDVGLGTPALNRTRVKKTARYRRANLNGIEAEGRRNSAGIESVGTRDCARGLDHAHAGASC